MINGQYPMLYVSIPKEATGFGCQGTPCSRREYTPQPRYGVACVVSLGASGLTNFEEMRWQETQAIVQNSVIAYQRIRLICGGVRNVVIITMGYMVAHMKILITVPSVGNL